MKFMQGEGGNRTFTMSLRDKYSFRPLVIVKNRLEIIIIV